MAFVSGFSGLSTCDRRLNYTPPPGIVLGFLPDSLLGRDPTLMGPPMERPRRAGATRNSKFLIVHPVGTTEDGIGIHMPPVYRFVVGADASEIGRALRDALVVSTTLNPPRLWQDGRELMKDFLKAAGARSWRSRSRLRMTMTLPGSAGRCIAPRPRASLE